MATVTKPIALDESFNTTEVTPRNIADVLAEGLSHITGRTASEVEYDNTDSGLTADNVQDALDEIAESVPTLPTTDIQTAVDEFSTYNGGLLSECNVTLEPIQDLHGYAEPWAGGAGKNKAPLRLSTIKSLNTIGTWSDNVYVESGITATFYTLSDTDDSIVKIHVQGTSTAPVNISLLTENDVSWLGSLSTVIVNGSPSNAQVNTECLIVNVNNGSSLYIEPSKNISVSSATAFRFRLGVWNGKTVNSDYYPMVRDVSVVDDSFAPYSNICPISGHTQVDVDVSDGQTTQEQITVNLGGTYYSGTLDVVSGVFTPDKVGINLSDIGWSGTNGKFYSTNPISDIKHGDGRYDYAISSGYKTANKSSLSQLTDGETSVDASGYLQIKDMQYTTSASFVSDRGSIQIVYELATPATIQLSPTMVKALVGENHLAAPLDGQEITESKYRELFTWDEVEAYVNAHSGGGSGMNYSTEEQVVGTWIDNKPLYTKTIVYTPSGTISTNTTIANIPNAKVMRVTEATAYNSSENRGYTLPDVRANGGTKITYDDGDVTLEIISDSWSNSWTFYVTVQYTKTTD